MGVKFRPDKYIVGDTIPFFWEGEYHVFYLKGLKTPNIPLRFKTSWGHLVSLDLTKWQELPDGFGPGPKGTPDSTGVWHGTILEKDGIFHLLYTGYNSEAPDYPQTICHASSTDLIKWEKDPNNPILVPDTEKYENRDWRDPFVFWNSEEKKYWMLITARRRKGPYLRRGCLVLATSSNLLKWEIDSTFFAPDLSFTYEASQLFKLGDKWYLMWNDFMMPMATYYRVSDNCCGPWRTPKADRFDGPYYYGGKTGEDKNSRYYFAWIPTRFGDWDIGYWEWGGEIGIPREITQQEDGSLAFRCPSRIVDSYSKILKIGIVPKIGNWEFDSIGNCIVGDRNDGYAYTEIPVDVSNFLFELDLILESGTSSAGIFFKALPNISMGCSLRVDASYSRVVIDHWPIQVHIPWSAPPQSVFSADTTFSNDPSPLVEQTIEFKYGKPIKCQIFICDDVIQCFVDDRVTLTYRIYRDGAIPLGLFLQGGKVLFKNLKLRTT